MIPRSIRLDRLTSPEVGELLAEGFTTAIVPCGSTEQHGPHMALGADSVQATAVAEAVALALGNALVAPTAPFGCSDHHMKFAGTISIEAVTLEALYADCCRALERHGFKRFACLSGHAGNFSVLADMLPRLRQALPTSQIAAFTDINAYLNIWVDAAEKAGWPAAKIGGHGDLAETSVALALDPSLVLVDRSEPGYTGGLEHAVPAIFQSGLHAFAENGILGNPVGANAAFGRDCLEATVALVADFFRSEHAWVAASTPSATVTNASTGSEAGA